MRLLLCTDGSPHGQAAIRFGAILGRRSPEATTVLGVVETPSFWQAENRSEASHIQRALEEARHLLAGAPEPRFRTRKGHAAEEILEEAASGDYDLVVVGARGRRGITRFLLGSTAERIARHAPVPVLIVRGARDAMERVLVCTAGKEPGLAAVKCGGQVAHLIGAQVTVLHVMSQIAGRPVLPPDALEDLEAPAQTLMEHHTPEGICLEEAMDILTGLEVPARPLVRHGPVVEEILDEARQGAYDLLVIGAHATAGLMGLLLDDIAHQIISHADRPILVARPRREGSDG